MLVSARIVLFTALGPTSVTFEATLYLKPLAVCWSPIALKRPDRLKQRHCLQF